MPSIELHDARTLDEAGSILTQHAPDVRVLAGGTDLLVDLKVGRVSVGHVVSIDRIESLRGITEEDACVRIGAMTTLSELLKSPVISRCAAPVLDAAGRMAAPQIRNMATVGGNIASAVPCADLPPILIAMGAALQVWSTGNTRRIAMEVFFEGPRQTVLASGEILSAIEVPKAPKGFGAAYERFALRDGNAIAVASVAASLTVNDDREVTDARVVLGAVAPIPVLVEGASKALIGSPADEAARTKAAEAAIAAASPICDVRGSAEFRCEIIGVLTKRAIARALDRIP